MPDNGRVLLVDDDFFNVEVLEGYLAKFGYDIFKAYDGREAIKAFAEFRPDIVLLDVMMPGMDGYEVLQKLREDASTATIPVILLSALSERWNVRKGMESGADDYLGKPVLRQELLGAIRAQLKRRKGGPGGPGGHTSPASPSAPPAQSAPPAPGSSAASESGGDGRRHGH